ncbi:CLIP domain-containing serine protease B4-like isoform X1 [Topomyia yanbarensis]|uniref:CLIP domain-containing serine protease B4-like isoform X1 n=1 Tax=Topomyia yanbarensis TaxID=2498891 RepID=UPI00273BDAF8|nr:CLIP domain-containing serine protease B4-like isoform X1 [Topomyia yanbarensis]
MFRSCGLLVFVLLATLIAEGSALGQNDPCINPVGDSGLCVFLRECQPLVDIYNKPLISPDESNFVQSSRCGVAAGNKPLVCCAGLSVGPRKASLLRPNQCGLDLSDRVVGGQATELNEYPWTAVIQYRKPNGNYGFHCGGSVINTRYIITAAHCIKAIPRGWEAVGVRLGEYDLKNDGPDCKEGVCADIPVDVGIENIIVHENYNPQQKSQYDDIALIRFNRDVAFSEYIRAICLPVDDAERYRNNVGTAAFAAGWGRTETASSSNIKLKVELSITELNRCSAVYRPSGVALRDTQMCAGGVRGKDTCSGDSGGPLMKRIKSNWFLFGIVSFGPNKCGTKDVPGVYTNVAKYIDWIENNIE